MVGFRQRAGNGCFGGNPCRRDCARRERGRFPGSPAEEIALSTDDVATNWQSASGTPAESSAEEIALDANDVANEGDADWSDGSAASAVAAGVEAQTFDVADLGAEEEQQLTPPPSPFANDSGVPSLRIRSIQVGPDIEADTLELGADDVEPEAGAAQASEQWGELSGSADEAVPLATAAESLAEAQSTEPSAWSAAGGDAQQWSAEGAPSDATDTVGLQDASAAIELQPEWAADAVEPAAEDSAPIELQPEWASTASSEQPTADAASAWDAPAAESEGSASASVPSADVQGGWTPPSEEAPLIEAQSEWATPEAEAAPIAQASDGSATEEAAPIEAQPEWATEEAAPVEAQPEWATSEGTTPVAEQAEWGTAEAAPLDAQATSGGAAAVPTQPQWAAKKPRPTARTPSGPRLKPPSRRRSVRVGHRGRSRAD
ncbi:hypothetical protein [Corallococcus sp. 4LFB]|uniref:hypothetical protein n=1 Tax=Corallococcus sp. 4LFB TaxID=3383249 RepID=UPI003975B42C